MMRPLMYLLVLGGMIFCAGCSSKPLEIEGEPPLIAGQRFATAGQANDAALAAVLETIEVSGRVGSSPIVTREIATESLAWSRPLRNRQTETRREYVLLEGNDELMVVKLTVVGVGSKGVWEWGLEDWQIVEDQLTALYSPSE